MKMKADAASASDAEGDRDEEQKETLGSFLAFTLKLALAVLIFRSFFFSPFTIPSESMLPQLMNGDYLIASKWPYGYSRYSLPFGVPLIPGRIFADEPERGDIVIFKHPIDKTDYIKRVIALPGDRVRLENGRVILNGEPLARERLGDVAIATSPNTGCAWGGRRERGGDGRELCRYTAFRETAPSGESYAVLDFGQQPQDDTATVIVPEGSHVRDGRQSRQFAGQPLSRARRRRRRPGADGEPGRPRRIRRLVERRRRVLADALDLVHRRALGPDRQRAVTAIERETHDWLSGNGFSVNDADRWLAALTHGSAEAIRDYERLEFLGDRVLGLVIAAHLYAHSDADEGMLAQRLNALVSRAGCADIARALGVPDHVVLGRQARDDGAADSDNVLGDVMEALIGANFLDAGFEPTRALVLGLWRSAIAGRAGRAKHPKSALQEWAAANRRGVPAYELVERAGPGHRQRFTVRVSVHAVGEAEGDGASKHAAETAAAEAFMERYS